MRHYYISPVIEVLEDIASEVICSSEGRYSDLGDNTNPVVQDNTDFDPDSGHGRDTDGSGNRSKGSSWDDDWDF